MVRIITVSLVVGLFLHRPVLAQETPSASPTNPPGRATVSSAPLPPSAAPAQPAGSDQPKEALPLARPTGVEPWSSSSAWDWNLLPLKGFAALPGYGRIDPFNLGIVWPFEDPDFLPGHGERRNWLAVRAGVWGVTRQGSPTKVGEWQSLRSSEFWDIDGLFTDGGRTFNFFASGLDNETNQGLFQFYGPGWRASADFQRFLHRLDHDPIANISSERLPVPSGFSGIYKTDLNAGEDYAIRVEQLKGQVVTDLSDHVKFRVQFFGMRKFGERQSDAMAHCFQARGVPGQNCHILSQRQQIDWRTAEVTPRLEARFGPVTIEYARLMRQFSQDDQRVFRDYTGLPPQLIVGTYPYAYVPDITTQMDQLRLNIDLAEKTVFYGFGYVGRLENHYRDIHRNIYGYDLRLTDTTLEGLQLTAYTKGYYQNGTTPETLLPDETQFLTPQQARANIREQIGFERTTAGVKSRYRPNFSDSLFCRLAFISGYEYDILSRPNAIYEQSDEAFSFAQPSTISHTIHAGVQQPWTPTLDSFARYKVQFISDPLFGFRETSGVINTGLPKQRHIVELGGGWYPVHNFGISAGQEFDLAWMHADISEVPGNVPDFNEQSYSSNISLWYAPTKKLALIASAAFMSNWIDQNITLGDDYIEPGNPPGALLRPITRPWFYGGQNSVLTFRADYRWTTALRTYAGYEFSRGKNAFDNRNFAELWPDLPNYSQVLVETHRVLAGVDWQPRECWTVYMRYIYFDYADKTAAINSGTAHMLLAGCSHVW